MGKIRSNGVPFAARDILRVGKGKLSLCLALEAEKIKPGATSLPKTASRGGRIQRCIYLVIVVKITVYVL